MLKRTGYIALLFVLILTSSFLIKQKNEVEEYIAKAAFIYNFTKFVEWDPNANNSNSFVIGVVGESPIFEALEDLATTKKINNKKIEVVKCNTVNPESCRCQILFVPEATKSTDFKNFLLAIAPKNVLIITERKGFLDYGSAINFLIIENRIRFEISVNTLNKCNLKASSQLLKLALTVQN